MDKTELLANIREFLGSAGFSVSDPYAVRLPGFDLVARRDETLLIIKVLSNIDGLSEAVGNELRALACLLKATPLLIGEKNGVSTLEDDVVYFRFGIQTVTSSTLKNHVLEEVPVRAYAAPGGLYVNLDPEKIRRLRQEKNISLGTFARHVRVSRRTVRMYEDGMNARIDIADRIEDMFEQSVTTPIDLLKPPMVETERLPSYQKEQKHMKEFQREVFSLLQNVGYKIIPMDRCPFEAVSKEKEKILLTCVQEYNKKLVEKAHFMSNISKIMEKHAVVFTDKDVSKKNVEGTPIIMKKELKKIRDPEDVFTLILERITAE
ncbi:MAG: transcriptional regulator [Thermoplasmata archaeon]|nr:transcriptional regulator [Thermoplasmata archaeon]MBE3138996.1 transcriptional regulator [Thermoplasmata archaeon]